MQWRALRLADRARFLRPAHRRSDRERPLPVDLPFLALALVAGGTLLYLGRSLTFWHDEWRSITFSDSALDFFRPVNEHWSTVPLLLYRSTFHVVELHSYLPYLAEVIVLHLVAVAAAYVLIRRRAGPLVATATSIPLLFLGTGAENLFWAFQTGFVGSVAFGLWAIVLLEQGGRVSSIGASLLLVTSLMCSGMGLVFMFVASGRTILDARIRHRGLAVLPPGVAYMIWHALAGREAVSEPGHLAGADTIVRFVLRGIAHAVGSFTGLASLPGGEPLALYLFVLLSLTTGWAVLRGRAVALAAGCLLGTITIYALAGSVRAHLDVDYATVRRYVYVAAFLIVLAVADLLPELRSLVRSRTRLARALVGGSAAVLGVCALVNLSALGDVRAQFQRHADLTRAHIELAQTHAGEPWVDQGAALGVMPPVPALLETLRRHGSPLHDMLVSGVVRTPGVDAYETALLGLVGDGFRVERGARSGEKVAIRVLEVRSFDVAPDDGCILLNGADRDAAIVVSLPGPSWITVTPSWKVQGSIALGHHLPPSRRIGLVLNANRSVAVRIPDIGDGADWAVRLDALSVTGRVRLCGTQARGEVGPGGA